MIAIRKLVRQIQTAVEEGAKEGVVEHLAVEYARLCSDAYKRLETCAAMLEKGSEYQALQLAEAEPPLLDVVAILSFEQAIIWADLCAERSLPCPEKFDAHLLQSLENVYAKGITPNHPLYRDYRAAVMSRNDAQAVQVIRSISRLNPEDANAKSEVQRLENKLFQQHLQILRGVLSDRSPMEVIACLEEIERFAGNARLEEIPEVNEAMRIRRVERQREAVLESGLLMEKLRFQYERGEWEGLSEILLSVKALVGAHEFSLPPEHAKLFQTVKGQDDQRRAEADQLRRLDEDLGRLSRQVGTMEARLEQQDGLSLGEGEALLIEVNRVWRRLEEGGGIVPPGLAQRTQNCVSAMRGELDKKRRMAGAKKWGGRIAVTGGALALLWILFFYANLFYNVQKLNRFKASGNLTAAESLAFEISKNNTQLASQTPMRVALKETESWGRVERTRSKEIQALFEEVDDTFKGNAKDIDFSIIAKKLALASEKVKNLSSELGVLHSRKLKELSLEMESLVKEGWGQNMKDAAEELSSLEKIAAEKLNSDQTRETLTSALEDVEARLKRMEAKIDTPVEGLEVPEQLHSQMITLRQRIDAAREKVNSVDILRQELNKALKLEDFKKALEALEKSEFKRFGEVVDASRLLSLFPNPEELAGGLFIPDAPKVWKTLTPEKRDAGFYPSEVNDAELTRFFEIRDDEFLNNIFEIEFLDYKNKNEKRILLLSGELGFKGSSYSVFSKREWSGKIYDPRSQQKTLPVFSMRTITSMQSASGVAGEGEVTAKAVSSASAFLYALELNKMTNEAGSLYERSLLQVFDQIVRHETKNFLLKAYLMQKVAQIFQMRPVEWGAPFCGSLKKDLARLAQIRDGVDFTNRDWMQESKHIRYFNTLKDFFQQIENHRYEFEARIHRRIAAKAFDAGIHYAGFIDGEGKTHFLGAEQDPRFLWFYSLETRRLVRMSARPVDAPKSMTVLFSIPLEGRAALREASLQVLGNNPATAVEIDIPFLATP
jgi:hypothetical protein